MHEGVNLLELDSKTTTTYARKLAIALWGEDMLKDYRMPNEYIKHPCKNGRMVLEGAENELKIRKLKGFISNTILHLNR